MRLLLPILLGACQDKTDSASVLGDDTDDTNAITDSGESGLPLDSADTTDTADTAEPDPVELTVEHFSPIGQEILGALDYFSGSQDSTWSFGADATFDDGWLLQTPAKHWGVPGEEVEADIECWEEGCDPDFGLRLCSDDTDCIDGGTCQEVLASVTAPGQTPTAMCVAHSDFLYDEMYLTLTEASEYADVSSLSEPDLRFLAALRNAVTYLDSAGSTTQVRVLFGQIPGLPLSTDDILSSLTRDISDDSGLTVNVGAYRVGYTSWNHSKIIAADGRVMLQGGHNLWTVDYLTTAPVHDLSMRIEGSAALSGHRFLDRLWEYPCEDHWFTGWTERSVFPGSAESCPEPYTLDFEPAYTGEARFITAGRLGDLGENAADEAILAAIGSAQHTLRFSLQDIGPIRIAGDLSLSDWPDDVMRELAYVMANDVDVYMALSTPSSTPGGGSNSYGNGWTAAEVAQAMEVWFDENEWVLPEGETARDLLCEHFYVAPLRYNADESVWASGANIGNHSKFFMVDDEVFYIGSQNLYVANLAEYGVFVDDVTMTAEVREQFWDPLWENTHVGAVSGADSSECSF